MRNFLFYGVCFAVGAVGAYYGQPYVRDNADAVLIIITVFSVFAGFLVAIITILGDPAMIPQGTWRTVEVRRQNVEHRIIRHIFLFIIYLVTIAILFAGSLIKKVPDEIISEIWKIWIDRSYLFLAISSFLMTLALPASLLKVQMGRLDTEIERRQATGDKGQSEAKQP